MVKPRGWTRHSREHSLAARGCSTKNRDVGAKGLTKPVTVEDAVGVIYDDYGMLDARVTVTRDKVVGLSEAIRKKVPGYNSFYGAEVADAILELHEKGHIMQIDFGREGSPVLYISPPYWDNQASNGPLRGDGEKVDRDAMITEIENVGRRLNADEISTTDYGQVRLWWD